MRHGEPERAKTANAVLLCVCGHTLAEHRGRICGNIECSECTCGDFEFEKLYRALDVTTHTKPGHLQLGTDGTLTFVEGGPKGPDHA